MIPSTPMKRVSVSVEKTDDSYIFHRLIRNIDNEKNFLNELFTRALEVKSGKALLEKGAAFTWLNTYAQELEELGFKIRQANQSEKNFFIGESSLSLEVSENNDWFDVHGLVRFGPFEIPFIKLRPYILNRKNEFKLPNGQIAIIPDEWFTQYIELFAFTEGDQALAECVAQPGLRRSVDQRVRRQSAGRQRSAGSVEAGVLRRRAGAEPLGQEVLRSLLHRRLPQVQTPTRLYRHHRNAAAGKTALPL